MISITKADFDVELVSTSAQSALFAALRRGGTECITTSRGDWETHVMGVWHFVVLTGQGNMFQTTQWHIPRYELAAALRVQDQFNKSESYPHPSYASYMPLPTRIHGRNKLEFLLCDEDEGFHLKETFVLELKKDLPILEKAIDRVRERGGGHYIPRLKSHAGHPVQSSSENLMRAIAFEKSTYPRMIAENFGIYSAYCTCEDFGMSIRMDDGLIRDLLAGQFEYDPEVVPSEMHELFLGTQNRLLSKPVWGRGIDMDIDEAVPILGEGMARLTRTQRVQFILMNGMHNAGLFLPLSVVLGACDFETYADHICGGFQPDSPQEQVRRKEIAYIRLYGELAVGR